MRILSLLFLSFMVCQTSFAQINIATSGTPSTLYLGSPSLIQTTSGTLIISHDFFGSTAPTNGLGKMYQSEIYESTNNGTSWSSLGTVNDLFWGSLFEYSGSLYSLGFSHQYGDFIIRKSSDYGTTWGSNVVLDSVDYRHSAGGQPPVVHDGKFWFSYETSPSDSAWGGFTIKIAWVDLADDIMTSGNWNFSSTVAWSSAHEGTNWDNPAMLESHAFVDINGDLKILSRVNSDPETTGFAMLFDVNSTTGVISNGQRVNMPGGDKKFQIQVANGRIWTINNPNIYPVGLYTASESRNVVALYSSTDGINWQLHKRLIDNSDLDPTQYGDQYISWEFDGNDLIMATRTADASADNAHNSNKIDFYRFTDWDEDWLGVGL